MSKTSCKICILWQDTLTRNYFIGAVSQYKDNFLLKGGSLLRAMNEFKPILQFLRHFPKALSGLNKKYSTSNPQPIGFSGILLAKRQNSFYCTYFLHNRNVADTKSPYPIKRLEVIRWFNQKSMVFNQSLS